VNDAQSSAARRTAGAALVLLLHIALVAALINAISETPRIAQAEREIMLQFLPPPNKPKPLPGHRSEGRPSPALPDYHGITLPPAAPEAPSLGGLGRSLFGCSPENLANLPPDERTRCAAAMAMGPGNSVDFRDHVNRSADAALWERDRARKNSPFLLPCMSPQGFSPLYTAYCAAKTALDGKFDPEDQLGYQDLPDHTVNEGNTRMAPVPH
jgi:hypothetical protein